jgi:GNAT superfamily N-acetyltransferase
MSGKDFHPMMVYTGNPKDCVEGTVFEITPEELQQADSYEVKEYKRISASTASGKNVWVYVSAEDNTPLTHRKASVDDLNAIIALLLEPDELGQVRESLAETLDSRYIEAFHHIDNDPNHYLMIVELGQEIIGTCHLTLLPSLSFHGSTRLLIEEVRVAQKYRQQKFGEWMMKEAIAYGRAKGASIIQLTTNKKRPRAKQFYDKLGFEASHEGMKLYLK